MTPEAAVLPDTADFDVGVAPELNRALLAKPRGAFSAARLRVLPISKLCETFAMNPLRPVKKVMPNWAEMIAKTLLRGWPVALARDTYDDIAQCDMFENETYRVLVKEHKDGVTLLSIWRHDRAPVHSWPDFQLIKNQLCGEEREAMELYPAQSRVVDSENQYHLWVMPAGKTIPIGFPAGFTR